MSVADLVSSSDWNSLLGEPDSSSSNGRQDDMPYSGKPFLHSWLSLCRETHYSDVIMGEMVFQITGLTIIYSTVYSGANQNKHQSSASLTFVREIHQWPANFPHKGPVTRKMFPFDDVIMDGWIHPRFQQSQLLTSNGRENIHRHIR